MDLLNNLKKNEMNDPYIILGTSTGQLFAKNSTGLYSLNEKYCTTEQKSNNEKTKFNSIKNISAKTNNIFNEFETSPRDINQKVISKNLTISSFVSSNSNTGNSLNVTLVPQGNLPICWAATVACMVSYRNKVSLSATNVCDTMGVPYAGQDPAGVPVNALNHYGVKSTFLNSVPSFSTIMDSIDNGKPIYMSSTSSIGGHATTLYGYLTSSQGVGILLMDSAYACAKQGYSSGNTFTFDFGGTKMTWTRTIMIDSTPYPGAVQYGQTGYYVGMVQTRLNALGFNCGSVDNSFGPATKAAVINFQASRGLDKDGSVGPITWSYLFNK